MRVLITGAGGLLGQELDAAFSAPHREVVAAGREVLDVTDRDAVMAAVTGFGPDAVVHAAAHTAVDDCEADPDTAFLVNALGTRHVAGAARHVGAHLTCFSTDYVFDGAKEGPYHEWDEPRPLSVYGRSKLAGEREAGSDALVVRTSWLFGARASNIVTTILRLAAGEGPLRFVDDQRGNPTSAADLAAAVVELVLARERGLIHVTNQGPVTWYELAREVLELAGHDPGRVEPIASSEIDPPRPAPRPASSVLDNAALRLRGLPLLPHHRESLEPVVKQLTENKQVDQ